MRPQLKWFDAILPVGLALLVTPLFVASRLPGQPSYYALGGLALILAYVVLRWELIARLIGRRQLRYGGNMVALAAAVLGILVVVNAIVTRYVNRWDFTKERRYGLSDQTRKILANLKDDVRITYFDYREGPEADAEDQQAKDRLREYQAHSSHLKVEFSDPLRDPAVAVRYELTPGTKMVIERGVKRERVTGISEQDVTNALIRVTRDRKKKICFVTGEGEPGIEDTTRAGYGGARHALEGNSYDVATVSLLGDVDLSGTCDALVLAGPQKDLPQQNAERLREYVQKGGEALILLEPEFGGALPNLTALLKSWNIETAHDVLIEIVRLLGLTAASAEFGVRQLPPHEITSEMQGKALVFRTARSIEPAKAHVEGVTLQKILETSANAWAEADLTLQKPNRAKGRPGPLAFGVAAMLKVRSAAAAPAASPAPSPTPEEKGAEAEARLVVIGDADFAGNGLLSELGNEDFFLNTVAWLVKDTDLISVRPNPPGAQRLRLGLTTGSFWVVAILALFGLPGLFVVWGIVVWWRRR